MKLKNLVLIPVILAILAATAWSVYKSSKSGAPLQTPQTVTTNVPADNFFETLYRERLKEEGDRTAKVEKMIKEGKLSDKPARYTKSTMNLPPPTPPYKGGGKEPAQ